MSPSRSARRLPDGCVTPCYDPAMAMRDHGPRALVVTIAGYGHVPALNVPEPFELVQRFLASA